MLVGIVEPGSNIELLYFDDGEIVEREFIEPGTSSAALDNDAVIIKTVPLS
jgi:hypothetical protein